MKKTEQFLSKKEVCGSLGISQPTLWRWYKHGTFPRPVRLGPARVAWVKREVDNWIEQQLEQREQEGD